MIDLLWYSSTSSVSQRLVPEKGRFERLDGPCLPFLATMFHAVGLNVIDPRERKSDVLDTSREALGTMIAKGLRC